jgi:hypothetical protein
MTSPAPTALLAAALLLAGAALTGCGATSTNDASTTEAATSGATTDAPGADPSSPSAPTTPGEPGCDSVLTDAARAQLEADGLEQVDVGASTYYAIADDLVEAGGLACKWGRPSSDVSMTVVQLSGVDVATSEWPAALAAEGYVETGDPVPGAYTGPADPGTGLPSVVVVTADRLTFVSAPTFAVDVAAE